MSGNQGDPVPGAQGGVHPSTSLNSEKEGGSHRESELPVVAKKSGNADGAKGRRFGIMNK